MKTRRITYSEINSDWWNKRSTLKVPTKVVVTKCRVVRGHHGGFRITDKEVVVKGRRGCWTSTNKVG